MVKILMLALSLTVFLPPSYSSADELGQWYANFKIQLPGVWADILRPAIRKTHPNVNSHVLNRIVIRIKEDACDFSPAAGERSDGTPEIVIPTGYIRLWLYSDQARLLFHSDDARFSAPDVYVSYIRSHLKTVIKKVIATCATRDAGERGSVPGTAVARELGLTDDEYIRLLSRLKQRPDQMMLAHQFGFGILFVVVHEAGHLLLNESAGIQGEFEMDQFAAKVFQQQGQSTFLAIGGIAVLAFAKSSNDDPPNSDTDICRVYRLVDDDPFVAEHLEGAGIEHFAPAMERQRRHLARDLSSACTQ
jgi:hypothetical protein